MKPRYLKIKSKFKSLLTNYNQVLLVEMENLKSTQLHDLRKHLRSKAEIIVSKKSFLVYLLKIQNKNLLKSWDFLKTELKNNIGLMFTQIDPLIINRILKSYFIKSFALSGDIAQKDIKIKKGNKKISPSQTPFFQALGIPTRVSKGSIEITENILLVKKNEIINDSHEALLKKLNIKPFKFGMKIIKIFYNRHNINTRILNDNNNSIKFNIIRSIKKLYVRLTAYGFLSKCLIPFNIHSFKTYYLKLYSYLVIKIK